MGQSLASPLMLILLAASAAAAWLGQHLDAGIIVVTVLLSVALDAVQTARSTSAADRLRQSIVPTATVFRNGGWQELTRAELVPGDVVHLAAGTLIPADARVVESVALHVEESALTGESVPAEKGVGAEVFLGTSVVAGSAVAEVTATGSRTAFGDIAARLGDVPPETAFARGLRDLGRLLSGTVVFLVLFLMLASIVMHRDALESLLFAVALAVGIVPEFMPMITTLTLSSGAVRMARKQVIVKHLAAIQNFGGIDVLCSDKTGTLTRGSLALLASLDSHGMPCHDTLRIGATNARFSTGVRSPLDDAILAAAPVAAEQWAKESELPFDFERRRVSVVVMRDGARTLITKGAPESVLACCTRFQSRDGAATLDDAAREAIGSVIAGIAAKGQRVLAVATRELAPGERSTRDAERELTLRGVLAFADEPLPDAAAAIAALAADGVSLKIITGDDAAVALHVCAQTGMTEPRVMLGDAFDKVTDAAIGAVAERTDLFARVSPRQKLRIVMALKSRGHVVGYMGDGINDAPALHAADVGISVASAVDVAREAADIVLIERGLGVLHAGILEGRRAYGNIMKYLLMATSSSFGNMFSMAVASVVIPSLPMLPTQILLNNFLYDLAQVALPADRVDDEYLRTPHRWDMRVIRSFMIRVGLVSSLFDFLTFAVLLRVFPGDEARFHTGWFLESLVTQVCVLFVIRTARNPLTSRPSGALVATVALALALGVALPFVPFAAALGFVAPPAWFLLYVAVATTTYLALVNVVKRRTRGLSDVA